MLRFAGFELDQRRAELRGPGGASMRLRPKSFAVLNILAANAGRVVSKQELMEAVWPNIHVGEDSLFQCVREIRAALGDDERQLIKVVSGRGYLFEAEVSGEPVGLAGQAAPPFTAAENERQVEDGASIAVAATTEAAKRRFSLFGLRGRAAAALAGLCAVVGFAIAAPIFAPDLIFKRAPPAIAVMAIVETGSDPQTASMAAGVTDRLTDGLAGIETVRVVAPRPASTSAEDASARSAGADLVLNGALQKGANAWTLEARVTDATTGEVKWTTSVSVGSDGDAALQQSRLAAGLGHELALRMNALQYPAAPSGNARVVVEQAMASINQTSRERFAASQAMLENALADDPDNVDLQVTLAGLQTRGIQMVWYSPAESAKVESMARSLLERALRVRPRSIPALEAYCRFLTATNNFVESLVACARVLSFDPWNGGALYQLGLTQLFLGRFEDALASFRQADRFDTPAVSRWTWLLGIGWANLFMDRNEEAVPWLEKSIAITPASGRSYMTLAAAYQRLGQMDKATAAMAKGLELRPGTTALNVAPPTRNVSPVYLEAARRSIQSMVEAGLPEG